MVRLGAGLVVTLNDTAISAVALVAGDPHASFRHFTPNPALGVIHKPHFGCPVNADDVSPLFFRGIYWLQDAVQVGTEEALNFIAGFLFFDQHFAASAVPGHVISRQPVLYVTPIAALMYGAQTQLANNNLVALRIVLFKADITDDVVFHQILITFDLGVGICVLQLHH